MHRVNVRELVPALCVPAGNEDSASKLRLAFRAHTMFFQEVNCSIQLEHVVSATLGRDELVALLCETYSRAVFETLFGIHFDGADAQADRLLLESIRGQLGAGIAYAVHAEVEARGVVIERPDVAPPKPDMEPEPER